jgi:hypothetical protein
MKPGSGRVSVGIGIVIALAAVGILAALVLRSPGAAPSPEPAASAVAAVGSAAEAGAPDTGAGGDAGGVGGDGGSAGPQTSPPGYTQAIVRGARDLWYELAYPEDWELDPTSDQILMVSHDIEAEPGALVKLQIERGLGVAGRDPSYYPAGTITSTMLVDGRAATRYDLPVETLAEGGVGCSVAVGVGPAAPPLERAEPSQANELMIDFHVLGVAEAAECQTYLATLDEILQLVHFVPDTTSAGPWQNEALAPSPIAKIRRIDVARPAGWSVVGEPAAVTIRSDGAWPGGSIHIRAEPLQAPEYFDGATDLPGGLGPGVRLVSTAVSDGLRTTEFAAANTSPVKWVVVAPDLPVGQPGYWENEQAIWRVMSETAFSHDWSTGYP